MSDMDTVISQIKTNLVTMTADLQNMITQGYRTDVIAVQKRSIKDLKDLLDLAYEEKAREDIGETTTRVSVGRYKAFRS